jgi:hypothetical protein
MNSTINIKTYLHGNIYERNDDGSLVLKHSFVQKNMLLNTGKANLYSKMFGASGGSTLAVTKMLFGNGVGAVSETDTLSSFGTLVHINNLGVKTVSNNSLNIAFSLSETEFNGVAITSVGLGVASTPVIPYNRIELTGNNIITKLNNIVFSGTWNITFIG